MFERIFLSKVRSFISDSLPNDPIKGWVYDPDRNAIILSAGIEIDETIPQSLRVKFEAVYK